MNLTELRHLRPGKTWVVLGVALAIGGLAALAARGYLSAQIKEIEARGKGKTAIVVVAKSDLAKGEKLSPANAAVREVPAEYAHSIALTPENFDRFSGQALAYPVKSGEMILLGLMEPQKLPTFSARVEAGHRAITVAVDEINSISGMIEPGDTIDLIVSVDQQGRKASFPLLESVLVMATGQRSVDDPKSGERRNYSTVTLDTTPQQARNLIAARDVGKITALLRNPQDRAVLSKTGYDFSASVASHEAGPQTGVRRGVPVLYGGNLSSMSPDALRLGVRPPGMQREPISDPLAPPGARPAGHASPGLTLQP